MSETTTTLPIDQIRYVKELQPRIDVSDATIEQYRTALDKLPPIVVARGSVLVDGYHRWQAHLREGAGFVDVEDLGNLTDDEIFREAVVRNAAHGRQLSLVDKRRVAERAYPTMDPATAVASLAEWLAVDERTVQRWTKDARAAQKEARQSRAWELWLDCLTQDQIAEHIGEPRKTISNWVSGQNDRLSQMAIVPGESDERPWGNVQHFDIWQFATADKGDGAQSYFGAVPPQVIENLLWFFTEPGQIVVDLFAGSGTTVDVAKRMGRRVWAADIRGNHYSPHLPIHVHDATTGWPDRAPRKADLVFLDPPYWRQAKGRYSTEPGEMAEMDLDAFYAAWRTVVKAVIEHTGRVAYIVSPAEVKDDGIVVDLATEMLAAFTDDGWRVERRVIVPYSTQQATGQQVTWARDNKRMLKLYRDLVVMSR